MPRTVTNPTIDPNDTIPPLMRTPNTPPVSAIDRAHRFFHLLGLRPQDAHVGSEKSDKRYLLRRRTNVDALVTESGDVVEIEESLPPARIPAAVRAAAEKRAGKDAKFERKTLYLYEIHFKKNGKNQELIVTADARPYHEDIQQNEKKEDSDSDK